MNEDHTRKKPWIWQRLLERSHSAHNLPDQSRRDVTNTAPSRGRHRFADNIFRNIFKSGLSRSAEQLLDFPPVTPDASTWDYSSTHPNRDPSPYTGLVSDPNVIWDTTNSSNAKVGLPYPNRRIEDANRAFTSVKDFSGIMRTTPSTSYLRSGLNTVDTVTPLIAPLKVFNSIVNGIGDIHPYAKVVLSVFTYASGMILAQHDRDNAVQNLLKKLSEVYTFMNEDGRLAEIQTMQAVYGNVARQTLECADFIVHYAETTSAWKRLAKDVFKETDAMIQKYGKALEALMQQIRDHAIRDTVVKVHRIAEDLDLKDMAYVDGAGRDTSKCCLPGTREYILSEIEGWIDSTGEVVQRVFWLSGAAGKGKSAIAHTIARWFHERGGPGAFFCFDRTREADQRHEKIFTTIARDLAYRDPVIWRALANAAHEDNELRHTKDIIRQWKKFILDPVEAASEAIAEPVLIVIDALDESGEASSREQILRALVGKLDPFSSDLTTLPENLRVLVTSRPLGDIREALYGASHIHHVSMDDSTHVSIESSNRDIQRYMSTKLGHLQGLNDESFQKLARISDGLFEWARLACEYIKNPNIVDDDPMERLESIIAGTSGRGTSLLDGMYIRILEQFLPVGQDEKANAKFRSVMGQIIASLEPLPVTALNVIRQCFPLGGDHYNVDQVIRPLGSLFTGTTDSRTPIRPIHTTFFEFLTDELRSKKFFVDQSPLAQRDLAFASLRIMKRELRFNICSLENSYSPNSAIADLEKRVGRTISPQLSYCCRFWGTHVGATSVEQLLVEEVKAFFDKEYLLFWLEAVSLLKVVSGAVETLSCIARWLTGHVEYIDIVDAVRDALRFVRTFAPAISHSTPHLYISALPLAPKESVIFKKFIAKFPRSPWAVSGHVEHWPSMEQTIHLDFVINPGAISLDGRRIACGLLEGGIRILDMVTGESLNAPSLFSGNNGKCLSIAISTNGDHIVSGSRDHMVRVWDANTGKILGAPLEGHTRGVQTVAISPDGTRIVSGSSDKTVRVWDMSTRKALYAPLRGHINAVMCIAISPDGHRIFSISSDGIRIWDLNTGNIIRVVYFQGHTGNFYGISLDGNRIVSRSKETIQVWDATTGNLLCALLQQNISAITISPNGNLIASGSNDGTIRIWDALTGEMLGKPLQGHIRTVTSIAVSPDGNRIVSYSLDKTIRIWDANARKALDAPVSRRTMDHIRSVAISSDKTLILSTADHTIYVWDGVTGRILGAPLTGYAGVISSVAISPDGNLFVSGSEDKTIQVWDAMTRKALGPPLKWHNSVPHSITFSPDGKRIVSLSHSGRRVLACFWDSVTGGTSDIPLEEDTHWIRSESIIYSLGSDPILSRSYDEPIQMWDAMDETLPRSSHFKSDISSSGVVAVAANKMLTMFHSNSSAETIALSHSISSVAISPETTNLVAVCPYNGEIHTWNRVTGGTFSACLDQCSHTSTSSVAISLDHIVTGIYHGTIRVWDAMTCEALGAPLQGHTGAVVYIAISADGKRIVSASEDRTIRVWDLEFFTQPQLSDAHAIFFSSSPTHALCSASSFLQGLGTHVSVFLRGDGWIVGPEGRLLLWIPASLYPAVYTPGTKLVISQTDALQLDLSQFTHGMSWPECRENDGMASL